MSSGKSNYLINKELNHALNGGAWVSPATVWLRLYTTVLTAAGVGTEVVAASYSPVSITCDVTNFPTTTDQQAENGVQISVGTAGENWGTLRAWGLWDAQSGGNLLFWGDILPEGVPPGMEVLAGAIMKVPVGMLQIGQINTP